MTFIDSSGLRALLRLWERARSEDLPMAVVPGSEQVRQTMDLTGIATLLPLAGEPPASAPA